MEWQRGVTLPELVFAMAIVAGLLGWGPSFASWQRNVERTREVNQFVQALYWRAARSIKRNGVVSLCQRCGSHAPDGHAVAARLDRVREP